MQSEHKSCVLHYRESGGETGGKEGGEMSNVRHDPEILTRILVKKHAKLAIDARGVYLDTSENIMKA